MHILLGHYDPAWLFQNKSKLDLSNRLSKQKEREKTIHLKTLTDVSKDEKISCRYETKDWCIK